ncbi:unnamed protein product [Mytilus coruscus]|uniref:Uncharacterized protein n=1 Tax=Mytilus coruscus TaxID=42192 RepID=A0A6J8DEH7_MYTCO|nr:unnamed protein product [Mytilus coruscus]
MERSTCSFLFSDKIQCGRNINIVPSEKCLPLNNCKDDIQKHLRLCHISLATVTWEYDLIKERAGFFDELLDSLIICPNHRFMIGKGWRRSRLCMAKEPLPHCSGKHKASNTSVSLDQSRRIWRQIGILIPIGSENPMSAHTTSELQLEIEEPVHILDAIEIDDQHCIEASCSDYGDNNTEYTLSQTSEGSVWTPSASQEDGNSKKKKALDSFLLTCGASPVKKTLTAEWRGCSERTKSDYIIKTTKILNEVLNALVPGQETDVLQAIMERKKQNEDSLLNIISAAYIGCEDWGSQRQILSIVAHQVSYNELHALIPDLSRYKYGAARKHALSAGSGQKVPSTEITHEGITTEQINHFLDFIMSPAIITDIPFGESNLKLSNGEIISVPKIILNSVRTRVVQQSFSYCEEDTFEKKGSLSSYMRILHAIGPNVMKSMKGLDNYATDGAKAIESLQKIADLFGRLNKGKEWQDNICKLLTSSKQYLKLEYKTHVVKESEVADHCCTFALSDGTKDYTSSCSHLHQNSCSQCEELDTVLECLMEVSKDHKL